MKGEDVRECRVKSEDVRGCRVKGEGVRWGSKEKVRGDHTLYSSMIMASASCPPDLICSTSCLWRACEREGERRELGHTRFTQPPSLL